MGCNGRRLGAWIDPLGPGSLTRTMLADPYKNDGAGWRKSREADLRLHVCDTARESNGFRGIVPIRLSVSCGVPRRTSTVVSRAVTPSWRGFAVPHCHL